MKLLFIGDIVGEPGRRAVATLLPRLRADHRLDLVIANGENMAGGSGLTVATANEVFDSGVDVLTSGDHLWDQKEVSVLLANEPRFVRPLNYPAGTPGQGSTVVTAKDGSSVAVINVQGRTFMQALDNPFTTLEEHLLYLPGNPKIIFIDVHAEATSEKIALARMVDGRVSAVVGTHTHVQTADEQIFPKGTAFLCDAGFTGPHESILGRQIDPIIRRFLTNAPQRFTVASENVMLQGVIIEIDPATGKSISIERVNERCA